MNLKEILSISGYSGLFKFIAQGRNSFIVESIEDKTRMSVFNASKTMSLDDISIYTDEQEKPLREIFRSMVEKENELPLPGSKASNDELRKYFAAILPNFDRERVYASDIKKVVLWYAQLKKYDLLKFEEEDKPSTEAEEK